MVGLDLTEIEFDVINARVTAACNANGVVCDSYASKTCITEKGFWMQITGYENYFTEAELSQAIQFIPTQEETIEI